MASPDGCFLPPGQCPVNPKPGCIYPTCTSFSPVPLVCSPGATTLCVYQPATPNVCTPLPPCAVHSVPATNDVALALMVLLVVLIAGIAVRRKP